MCVCWWHVKCQFWARMNGWRWDESVRQTRLSGSLFLRICSIWMEDRSVGWVWFISIFSFLLFLTHLHLSTRWPWRKPRAPQSLRQISPCAEQRCSTQKRKKRGETKRETWGEWKLSTVAYPCAHFCFFFFFFFWDAMWNVIGICGRWFVVRVGTGLEWKVMQGSWWRGDRRSHKSGACVMTRQTIRDAVSGKRYRFPRSIYRPPAMDSSVICITNKLQIDNIYAYIYQIYWY